MIYYNVVIPHPIGIADPTRKQHFEKKIAEYLQRAEEIKKEISGYASRGEIKNKILIIDGGTGKSYKTVFGKYLTRDVKKITIEDPYIQKYHQLVNLVKFCELAVEQCLSLRNIHVTTKKDSGEQSIAFESLKQSLLERSNISIQFDFSDNIHDRQVLYVLFFFTIRVFPHLFEIIILIRSPTLQAE